MGTTNISKANAHALDQKAIAGVDKYFAKVKTLTLAGTTYTPSTLKATLQAEIDANTSLDDLRAQFKQQAASTRTARAKARAARKALKAYVLGVYGADAVQMLEDFGMTKSQGTLSVKAKADAVAKAQATRKARHTMGKRQKRTIKGEPETTNEAPETPAPSASSKVGASAAKTATSS